MFVVFYDLSVDFFPKLYLDISLDKTINTVSQTQWSASSPDGDRLHCSPISRLCMSIKLWLAGSNDKLINASWKVKQTSLSPLDKLFLD